MSLEFRYAVSFPWDYYRGLRAFADSDPGVVTTYVPDGPSVVFDFRTSRMLFDAGRYLYVLAEAFGQAGVAVHVVKNRSFLARAGRKYWARAALSLPNVQAEWLQGTAGSPLGRLGDQDTSRPGLAFGDRYVEGADVFPYPMHPLSYASADLHELRCHRLFSRPSKVFFSGNVNHKYENSILENKFGVVSRGKLIAALNEDPSVQIPPQQKEYGELCGLLRAPTAASLVINDRNQCSIPNHRWLETLSLVDFFLCCPGVSHPHCHNAIEAMSVGTIPIIEFPQLFSPPLEDGVNAITFQGSDSVAGAVGRALDASAEDRQRMSRQVIRYYQEHLCIRRFAQQWIERGASRPIHFPYIPK